MAALLFSYVLSYYITDRHQLAGDDAAQRSALLQTIARASSAGVNYVQLREKDLEPRDLESLAREAVQTAAANGNAQVLVNHRTDVAVAAGAAGVHLTGTDVAARQARAVAAAAGRDDFLVAVSCHSLEDVRVAVADEADLLVLAPIFEKAATGSPGIGLEALQAASAALNEAADGKLPALVALGGVTLQNAAHCGRCGAAGVAAIRLFQQAPDLAALVQTIRAL